MDEKQIQEIVKNMFKNGDIKIYVETDGGHYLDKMKVSTKVQVYIDSKCVQEVSDTAYLTPSTFTGRW